MRQNVRNEEVFSGGFLGRLAADRKKTLMAVCLIGLMAFMWIRVFVGKSPQSTEASTLSEAAKAAPAVKESQSQILFTELPSLRGRDGLTRDFFDCRQWKGLGGKAEGNSSSLREVMVNAGDNEQEYIRRVAEQLKLQAIELGGRPHAFINDKLLSEADRLFVGDKDSGCECQVVQIRENKVVVKCRQSIIESKLAQAGEVSD